MSGGCVENDVWLRALAVLDDGEPVIAKFSVAAGPPEGELGVSLSCGGAIDVLIERFRDDEVSRAASGALHERRAAVLAVALEPARLLGRRMAVVPGHAGAGSIAACLDRPIEAAACALLRGAAAPERRRFPFGDEEAVVFLEPMLPPPRLYVVGATDVAAALVKIAKTVGFDVVVLDPRAAYARRERFAEADDVISAWPGEALTSGALDERAHVVTLAHDPKLDVPALACALRSDAAYVGALGSRRTHERRKEALRALGFDDAALQRIASPVGLDLGGRSPAEIALAVVAEMVAMRNGRVPRVRAAAAPSPQRTSRGQEGGCAKRDDGPREGAHERATGRPALRAEERS